uniref:YspA cpYpsA-related SLOG domain-containing protein n=1 Tax=viral metagenome TaxID=1070528 RepID=A0A6C0CIS1_9ZZZZ
MKSPYVLLVVGSRHLECYDVFHKTMGIMLAKWGSAGYSPSLIISGGCRGVDTMAKRYAQEMKHAFEEFPAEWKLYGASAGPKRNTIMVQKADRVIAFVDEHSVGTWDTITKANKFPTKEVVVFKITEVKK